MVTFEGGKIVCVQTAIKEGQKSTKVMVVMMNIMVMMIVIMKVLVMEMVLVIHNLNLKLIWISNSSK